MECQLTISDGKLKGYERDGILCFHGIPYAKPPVGKLRFRMPEPAEPWEGVYDATYRHPVAPQKESDLDIPMGPVELPKDEDCLTLSVYTPSFEGSRPVAVWLHGGANCYCGGDLGWYDGARLAAKGDLVVVNLNFRLGPLGFLCCPGLNEENLCIEDQMLALRWIQKNIASFGGDPSRVTLFGQSAGGNAIAHILSRPDSEGLFGQIILESASLGRGNHLKEDAFEVGRAVLKELGIDTEDAEQMNKEVREKTAEELLDAADAVPAEIRAKHQGMIFKPVMDAWHTPEATVEAAAREAVRRGIRIMTGFTKDEIHAFMTARDPESLKKGAIGQHLRYEQPGTEFALAAAKGGLKVWKYRFEWKAPESVFDSCHCLELPFVFGNLEAWNAPMLKGASVEEMERLRETLQHFWTQFFRFEELDPAEWPLFTEETQKIKCFDNKENPVVQDSDYHC